MLGFFPCCFTQESVNPTVTSTFFSLAFLMRLFPNTIPSQIMLQIPFFEFKSCWFSPTSFGSPFSIIYGLLTLSFKTVHDLLTHPISSHLLPRCWFLPPISPSHQTSPFKNQAFLKSSFLKSSLFLLSFLPSMLSPHTGNNLKINSFWFSKIFLFINT